MLDNVIEMNKCGIYAIKCKDPTVQKVYIGSTKHLGQRINRHRYECNTEFRRNYNYPIYKYIRENGGFDNFEFDFLEEVTDEDILVIKEQEWIDLFPDELLLNATNAIKI